MNGLLIIYDLPEGDIEDMYVDFKLYNGDDECLMIENGASIRTLPRRKPMNEVRINNAIVNHIELYANQGWNTCLNVITGETE